MSADILARFYGLIFFSAIFIIAAVRVVISRRSQTSPAVLPVSRACTGCDDCCCMLWCGPCALDQLARQEYLASNSYSVEYDFYAATGVVPGVQYARPPV